MHIQPNLSPKWHHLMLGCLLIVFSSFSIAQTTKQKSADSAKQPASPVIPKDIVKFAENNNFSKLGYLMAEIDSVVITGNSVMVTFSEYVNIQKQSGMLLKVFTMVNNKPEAIKQFEIPKSCKTVIAYFGFNKDIGDNDLIAIRPANSKGGNIFDAANKGELLRVEEMLAQGVDSNSTKRNGWTVLMAASFAGHHEVVQALLDKGANVNARAVDGSTSLMQAAWMGRREIVQALLAKGANVNAQTNEGVTALMMASQNGYREIVQALLAKGANVNAQTNEGVTALIAASEEGRYEIVEELLAKGATVNAKAKDGATALIQAAWKGRREIVQALLAKDADVNARRNDGMTALMRASREGHHEIVQTLIEKGAIPNNQ